MSEKYLSYVKNNSKYLIAFTAVIGVLLVGGIVSSLSTSTSSGSYGETQNLAASGGLADSYDTTESMSRDLPGPRPRDGGDPDADQKKVITSYNIGFEAENIRAALSRTGELASNYGGWTDSENFNSGQTSDSGYITVRIPSENVSEFLSEAENSWKLKDKNQNKQDETSRYTELQLELKNKRQELRKLEELMNQTEEVESLIKIQERMSEIRSRVQYLENQMENIDQRVDYTEIRISFEQPESFTAEFELKRTFTDAYQGIFESLKLIIVGIGYLLPFAAIFALIYYGRRALKQRD